MKAPEGTPQDQLPEYLRKKSAADLSEAQAETSLSAESVFEKNKAIVKIRPSHF